MEIAPIVGIRALLSLRAAQADMRLPAIFDINASAKLGDNGGQDSKSKAAGAEEGEEDELVMESEPAVGIETLEDPSAKQVDYFA